MGDKRDNPEDQSAGIADGRATEGATQGLEEVQPGFVTDKKEWGTGLPWVSWERANLFGDI